MTTKQARPWALVLLLCAGAVSAQPQGRTVKGNIVDSLTQEGVPLAQITLKGTRQGVTTEVDGSFTFPGLPDGAVTLRIFSADFEPQDVAIAAGQDTVKVQLKLKYGEEMVVVGRATEVARKNLANAVSIVDNEELTRAPAETVDSALAGKVAGANIQSNSGAPGGGVQVRLRGVSTINGNSTPLYVIDGVLISDVAVASGVFAITGSREGSNNAPTQDNQVNRIADLNPEDIDSIEVLKGASAAAIYGSKASNGVIIINTKRGREGAPVAQVTQRVGFSQLSNTLGARRFATVDEAVEAFGTQAKDAFQPGVTYDHERELAGRLAPAFETSASFSGASQGTRYFASALVRNDEVIITNSVYEQESLRLKLSRTFGDAFEVNTSNYLIHKLARRGLTNNDTRGISYYMVLPSTPSFLDLRRRADGSYPINPFIGSHTNPLQTAALMTNDEDVWRLIGSADLSWRIVHTDSQDLKVLGNIGIDRFQQKNTLLFPPELFFEPLDDKLPGTSLFATTESRNLNAGVNLIHSYHPTSRLLSATTSAGFQQEERELSSVYIASRNLNAGETNVDAGTQVKVTENRQLIRDRGFYLQEEMLLLEDRLTLTGAVRGEQSSANGNPYALFFYPKAAAAFRVPHFTSALDELKVRVAYGETGNQPLYGMKFTPLSVTNNTEGNPGIIVGGTAGDPNIRPERQREIEVGVDAVAFNGRALLEFSLYQRNISDLLLQRTLAPSTGFTTRFFNGGALQNQGVELMLQGTPIQTQEGFVWLSRVQFSLNRSKVTDLPVPAFNTGGFGTGLGVFRIEQGASATQIVGNDGLREDGTCCIVRKIGDTEPAFRMSFVNNFSWKGLRLSTLFDWQQGSQVINLTRFLYDLSANTPDFATAGKQRLAQQATHASAYVEDASFLKLREISLSYDLPADWVNRSLGPIHSARITLSARNLLTFTGYSGLDPEVSNFGNQAIYRNIDVAPYPPSRSFWASVEVGF